MRRTELINISNSKKTRPQVDLLLNSKEFKLDIKKAREHIHAIEEDDGEYYTEISYLIFKYNLHRGWFDFLFKIIDSGEVDKNFDPEAIMIEYGKDEYNDVLAEETVAIHITPDTRLSDLEKVFKIAKKRFSPLETKKRDKKWIYFKRDQLVYELKKKGLSDLEISKNKNVRLNNLGQVKTIASTFLKKYKSMFPNKRIVR